MGLGCDAILRAYPLLMESKAGSKFLFCRASLPENRFALFRTHSKAHSGVTIIGTHTSDKTHGALKTKPLFELGRPQ